MSDGLSRLQQLRQQRTRPGPVWSIAPMIEGIQEQAKRHDKKLGEISDLWNELVPGELAMQTRLASIRGGALAVTVASAAVSYEIDRLLRDGLEAQIRGRFRGTLVRIRLSVGQIDDGERKNDRNRK